MLTQEDMQLLETLFDKKLEPINNRLDSVETRFDKKLEPINNRLGSIETLFDKKLEPINNRLDSIETNMAEMKESLAEVREAANYLLDLVDGKEKAIRKLPSINKGRHGFDGQKYPPYCVKPLENTALPCGSFLVWTHFCSGKTARPLPAMNLQVIFGF